MIEIARLRPEARARYDTYLSAITAASARAGVSASRSPISSNRALATCLATWTTRAIFLAALSSDEWNDAVAARRVAVTAAIVLIAGQNAIPPLTRAIFGEPLPASAFPTPHIAGTSPMEIVDALLRVYPDRGTDPYRRQLEVMVGFPGFREQPVHYVNLCAFGEGDDPAVLGGAAHDACNAAMQSVVARGGLPLLRAEVEHRIVSAIPWNRVIVVRWPSLAVFTDIRLDPESITAQPHRVESAETYGHFITITREA